MRAAVDATTATTGYDDVVAAPHVTAAVATAVAHLPAQ